jgi:hypothetical protein
MKTSITHTLYFLFFILCTFFHANFLYTSAAQPKNSQENLSYVATFSKNMADGTITGLIAALNNNREQISKTVQEIVKPGDIQNSVAESLTALQTTLAVATTNARTQGDDLIKNAHAQGRDLLDHSAQSAEQVMRSFSNEMIRTIAISACVIVAALVTYKIAAMMIEQYARKQEKKTKKKRLPTTVDF